MRRGAWVTIGSLLAAVGLATVWIPFTFHVGGVLLVAGLIMVLRNSRRSRRWFILWSRRHPRWGVPLRRLLRRNPEIGPVIWHEMLHLESWLVPRRFHRLAHWRSRWRTWRRARRARRTARRPQG